MTVSLVLFLALGCAPGAGPSHSVAATGTGDVALPAVAEALVPRVAVRARPRPKAATRAVMKSFRFDYRPTVFFVMARRSKKGVEWFKVKIPGRPNGRKGWVRASRLRLLGTAGPFRILVDRSRRRLTLFRGARPVFTSRVAVGTSDAPTPLGSFYVTAAFAPGDGFLGPWAFETSAYAAISDWPRGGIVGLHGTSETWSVGLKASHGCLRVYDRVILALKKRVRPGTPIRIRA